MIDSLRFISTMVLGLNEKRNSEEGATAVEYGLMVALIAVFIIGGVSFLAGGLDGLFREVGGKL